MDLPELVMFTLKVYWLPMTLISLGIRGERLKQTGIWVIGHLEAQISSIRRMCEIDNDPVAINSLIKPHIAITTSPEKASVLGSISQTSQFNSDNDQEDELMQMEIPEELKQANQMLGWHG